MSDNVRYVEPNYDAAVILHAVSGFKPDYDVQGKTRCLLCNRWCWLDEETLPAVLRGVASPVCVDCAAARLHPGERIGHVRDL